MVNVKHLIANGFVRAEICGIVVVKRLFDAKNNGDNIGSHS